MKTKKSKEIIANSACSEESSEEDHQISRTEFLTKDIKSMLLQTIADENTKEAAALSRVDD